MSITALVDGDFVGERLDLSSTGAGRGNIAARIDVTVLREEAEGRGEGEGSQEREAWGRTAGQRGPGFGCMPVQRRRANAAVRSTRLRRGNSRPRRERRRNEVG